MNIYKAFLVVVIIHGTPSLHAMDRPPATPNKPTYGGQNISIKDFLAQIREEDAQRRTPCVQESKMATPTADSKKTTPVKKVETNKKPE